MESTDHGQDQGMGNKSDEGLSGSEEKKMKPGLATVQERQQREGPFGRKTKASFFSECFAEGLWRSLGWVCDQWPDALSGIPEAYLF